jgi:hypothetical protein
LSFTNTSNFTTDQYLKLSNFIYENTYKNENIIITSLMSNAEINAQSLELYNASAVVLSKMAVPRYQITINTINFPTIFEFSSITGQFVLGDQITIETDENLLLSATLLEYSFNYEDPTDFSIVISNKQRINDSSFILSDYIPRVELLTFLSEMDFLINFENSGDAQKPSKLIDYLIVDRPVLSVKFKELNKDFIAEFLSGIYKNKIDLGDPSDYHIENIVESFISLYREKFNPQKSLS